MTGWDAAAAEWYAENFGEYATNRLAIDRLALAPDARVLDIGCGTGPALRHAAARVTQGTLIGVEPTPRMLELAREKCAGLPIELREGSAEALPVPDGAIDVLLAFDTMDHWADVPAGLVEARRVLAADGRLVVVKDLDAPSMGPTASPTDQLADAGFAVTEDTTVEADGVRFRMWTATRGG